MRNGFDRINEGMYSFYEKQYGDNLIDKILTYYVDKMRKYGKDCLTDKEKAIFDEAKMGKLSGNKPIYARDKVTGDIKIDDLTGRPVVIEQPDRVYPGVPFITQKGKGGVKKVIINARCYWNVDEPCRYYYVYTDSKIDSENPYGITVYKTESKDAKQYGSFLVPKSETTRKPEELWAWANDRYDKGVVLDKETLDLFVKFDTLYHTGRRENAAFLNEAYDKLKKYPRK